MNLNDNWLTPEYVLKGVEIAMPIIDLDPCANETNNCNALRYFTEQEDGLAKKWADDVFANNPYSRNVDWINKIAYEMAVARVQGEKLRIIQLCPTAVISNRGTKNLIANCMMIPLGRIKFTPPQELIDERLNKGLSANPGIPRSDVSLFFYGFSESDVCSVAEYFESSIWRLG